MCTGRTAAYLSRLEWRGPLAGLRPTSARRQGAATLLTYRLQPDVEITVRLRDAETEAEWSRRLLLAVQSAVGHGTTLWLDGRAAGAGWASTHSAEA